MKLTKKHYNRKVLSFGIMMFLAIALISTGFAAWIMSTGTEKEETGGANVGVITDGSLEFSDVAFTGNVKTFVFEPKEGDTSGEIKFDGENKENLVIEITGKVAPATYLDDLTIQVEMPASVKQAASEGYIVLPACCTAPVLLVDAGTAQDGGTTFEAVVDSSKDEVTFSYKIVIQWGTKFYNDNPSVSLDDPANDLDFAAKRALLIDFKKTIYGATVVGTNDDDNPLTMTEEELLKYNATIDFDITLIATAN